MKDIIRRILGKPIQVQEVTKNTKFTWEEINSALVAAGIKPSSIARVLTKLST